MAAAAMAKTAFKPKVFTSSNVLHVGSPKPSEQQAKETRTVVGDVNKAGQTAQLSGDGRAITAINRIEEIRVDASDWTVSNYEGRRLPDPKAIAYAEYDIGRITLNSARYFDRMIYYRVGRLVREALHLDSDYSDAHISEVNGGCHAWTCRNESNVDAHAGRVMQRWSPDRQ